jgi:hypothetical protein
MLSLKYKQLRPHYAMSPYNPVEKFDRLAVSLGATYKLIYNVPVRNWSLYNGTHSKTEQFSDHYFNADGLEIGYIIRGMIDLNTPRIHILETPRMWDRYFLTSAAYSRHSLVTQPQLLPCL